MANYWRLRGWDALNRAPTAARLDGVRCGTHSDAGGVNGLHYERRLTRAASPLDRVCADEPGIVPSFALAEGCESSPPKNNQILSRFAYACRAQQWKGCATHAGQRFAQYEFGSGLHVSRRKTRIARADLRYFRRMAELSSAALDEFFAALVLLRRKYKAAVDHGNRGSANRLVLRSDLNHFGLAGSPDGPRPALFQFFLGVRTVHRELWSNAFS